MSSLMILSCVIVTVCLTVIGGNPLPEQLNEKPPTHKILEGKTLLIVCNTTNDQDIEIYWTKNTSDSSFYQTGTKLQIVNINRNDSGVYICHAFNTSLPGDNTTEVNATVEVINIDVQYPADIPYFSVVPALLNENKNYTISFNIEGNPDPTWELGNRNTGKVLITANKTARGVLGPIAAMCEDTGYWMVTGRNTLNNGVNVTNGQNLTILCSPRPNPNAGGQMYNVEARIGTDALITMDVLGYPYPSYIWSRDDGKPISKKVTMFNLPNFTGLNISNVEVTDYGNYTLTMHNSLGTYVAHYKLTPYGKPEIPYNLTFCNVTYDSVTLTWTSGFDMGSKQHFLIMERIKDVFIQMSSRIYDNSTNHGVGQNWTYTQMGLVSDTDYELSVLSENADGYMSSVAKPSVKFRTKFYPNNSGDGSGLATKWIVVISTLASLALVGSLAYLVYFFKYRYFRTSYETMNK